MKKHFYTFILLTTIFCLKGFAQTYPPVIKNYADSVGSNYADLYLDLSPNDTGVVKIQIQLQQGTGNNEFDSIFSVPATDSVNVQLHLAPLNSCKMYNLLINLANAHQQGDVINPLLSFTTVCNTGIARVNESSFHVIAYPQSLELISQVLPENGIAQVYDLAGRLVLSVPVSQPVQQIPFNQSGGIYLLRITGGNQLQYFSRFVIY